MKNKSVKFFLFVTFTIISLFALSQQNGAVRGFVYDKEDGQPLGFVNVFLKGTNYGITTDINGLFTLTKIPEGEYTLSMVFLGYKTIEETINISSKKIYSKNFYLEKDFMMIDEVEVSGHREEQQNEVQVAIIKIAPAQIKELPSIGSEPDIAQYLQVLPGVNFTGDQGGQLYIRGGSTVQNLVLLDGMVIYNPFHSIGLFSVFDSDIMRNADVYTGGFNAEYGGRLSSVMDISTKDGNPNHFGGKLSASTFGAKLMLEGPIMKTNERGSSLSYIFSAKTSFLEKSSTVIYPYVNDRNGLPYSYNDFYGKISLNAAGGSKFDVFGFSFNDKVNYQNISPIDWSSFGGGANFVLVPSSSTSIIKATVAFSKYKIGMLNEIGLKNSSSVLGFNIGFDYVNYWGKNQLNWGISALGFNTNYEFYNFLGLRNVQEENTTELAAYLKFKWHLGALIIEPGFRIQHYASLGKASPEPRLGIKWNITEYIRLKAAAGLYSQNLVAANSDKDVVSLFYGFLSGNLNIQSKFDEKKLQKSQHVLAGLEIDITKQINVQVEGYLKNFSQIISLNRNKIFDDVPGNTGRPEELRKDYLMESGYAYGVDFLANYSTKQIYIYFVYSLGWVKRFDGKETYEPIFDRRHNINLVATYKFGKKLSWNISARWNLASGFPFTQTQGFYESPNFYENINYEYWSENGDLNILYGDYNKGRLPYFHRLDLTVTKTFQFKKNMKLEINLSVINVYNRKNIFYFDRESYTRVDQLPVLPSIGLNFTF
ncbi:MAG: TonB-dependent receptor [Bacteroidales bacterium]|jgi:outer membrane cobalamin receptor|nr:TonB-dependent receptor [Bacteroidales bacterium]